MGIEIKSVESDILIKNELTFYALSNIICYIVITINYFFWEEIFQMAFMAFVTAIIVGLTGIGMVPGEQKAKSQQSQPAQLTYVSEAAGTGNEPEQATEQDKLSEATEFWRNWLKVDRTGWLRHLDIDDVIDCERACDQTAILAGYDEAVALCGSRDAKNPWGDYTYEKCANPSTTATTKAAAMERVDDEIASFAPVLAEKVEVHNERYDSDLAFDVFKDELKDRTKNSGWDLSSLWHGYGDWYRRTECAGQHLARALDYMTEVNRNTTSCDWINDVAFDDSTIPFCEANTNFPGCEQFFSRLDECAANKDEL